MKEQGICRDGLECVSFCGVIRIIGVHAGRRTACANRHGDRKQPGDVRGRQPGVAGGSLSWHNCASARRKRDGQRCSCSRHSYAESAAPPYPFVDINCAALPDTLLETELFGVEAGAFTDAKYSRDGYLLRADGGTLFLDEIGSMPLHLQAKLLRFLETRRFRRVGSTKELQVDLRIVSASNIDLAQAVGAGLFRDDLYYRLKVITIRLPSLRDRPEDIEQLASHFLRQYAPEDGKPLRISEAAMHLLLRYAWPGNVRELRSVIQRGQIMCDGEEIGPEASPTRNSRRGHGKQRCAPARRTTGTNSPAAAGLDLPAFLERHRAPPGARGAGAMRRQPGATPPRCWA